MRYGIVKVSFSASESVGNSSKFSPGSKILWLPASVSEKFFRFPKRSGFYLVILVAISFLLDFLFVASKFVSLYSFTILPGDVELPKPAAERQAGTTSTAYLPIDGTFQHEIREAPDDQSDTERQLPDPERSLTQRNSTEGPPAYLPLAQHLRHINFNYTHKKPSLQDMAYGAQRKTLPDLKPTNNIDLERCEECVANARRVKNSSIPQGYLLQLSTVTTRLITYYKFSSMLVLPCEEEIHWILPLTNIIRLLRPGFETYCAVATDNIVVDLIKTYGQTELSGIRFVVYSPMSHGSLPQVDLMLTWRGLEQYTLDDIHKVFKETVTAGVKYTLIGNSPGLANARMIETEIETFSIVRPEVPALNVRAFPFGFQEARRVIPIMNRQLLFYKASEMRDKW